MKKRFLIWLPPLLMLACGLDAKSDQQAAMFSLTICPPEATPAPGWEWVCASEDTLAIDANSNGARITCFWTPRACKDES
jgi:hypothetical protein